MIRLENVRNMCRKILRFGPDLALSNLALVYGGRFLSHKTLRNVSEYRNRKIQLLLRPFMPPGNVTAPVPGHIRKNAIWVCWLQGEEQMPPIAGLCLESIRRNANGHEVILLTIDNYEDYVVMPEIFKERYRRGQLKPAHFADLIRIEVLSQQGGLWLDATMLVTQPIDEAVFNAPFYSIKTAEEGHFVSKCRWAVFALACPRNSGIMTKTGKAFENYLSSTDLFIDYFLFDHFIEMLYQTDESVREAIDTLPYNNPATHRLTPILTLDFNPSEFEVLTGSTSLFKLNIRAYTAKQLAGNPRSLYHHLVKEYIR